MSVPSFINKISDVIWEIPTSYKYGMLVPARILATEKLVGEMDDGVFEQITNVAQFPGIVGFAWAMPDAHWGYGAPVGAVFATDPDTGGIISPGAIGFDINCGMRLIRTNLTESDVRGHLEELLNGLYKRVPAGVGAEGFLKLSKKEIAELGVAGASWSVEKGMGLKDDLKHIEDGGRITPSNPEHVSDRAVSRGIQQLGTLGSGNHYLEIQVVKKENIFDKPSAYNLGIFENQIVIMLHCGSRGFGHQIATDYLRFFEKHLGDYNISVADRQLAALPFTSKQGQAYYGAMAVAANFAFANRQIITHEIRRVFNNIFGSSQLALVYDVAHNIAKLETYEENGQAKSLVVHRKGATRSFPGSPVIIGGSMETGSYLLSGQEKAKELTFGSTAHGSGRTMSRTQAKKQFQGKDLLKQMAKKGITVKSVSFSGLAEEAGLAYKDINEVVKSVEQAGISKPVVKLVPIGNIKG